MHFTQNPIGSDDQLDLQDNAISFDYAMNSPAALWQDRFGKQHKTVQQALKDVGFKPAGFDFVSGGTLGLGDRDKCVFYPTDGYWYSWNGKLPYVVTANSSPAPGGKKGWNPVNKDDRVIAREALRRTYQGVGLNLVDGSFEVGAKITSAKDVVLHEKTGKCYSGPIGTISPKTDPSGSSFKDLSTQTLQIDVNQKLDIQNVIDFSINTRTKIILSGDWETDILKISSFSYEKPWYLEVVGTIKANKIYFIGSANIHITGGVFTAPEIFIVGVRMSSFSHMVLDGTIFLAGWDAGFQVPGGSYSLYWNKFDHVQFHGIKVRTSISSSASFNNNTFDTCIFRSDTPAPLWEIDIVPGKTDPAMTSNTFIGCDWSYSDAWNFLYDYDIAFSVSVVGGYLDTNSAWYRETSVLHQNFEVIGLRNPSGVNLERRPLAGLKMTTGSARKITTLPVGCKSFLVESSGLIQPGTTALAVLPIPANGEYTFLAITKNITAGVITIKNKTTDKSFSFNPNIGVSSITVKLSKDDDVEVRWFNGGSIAIEVIEMTLTLGAGIYNAIPPKIWKKYEFDVSVTGVSNTPIKLLKIPKKLYESQSRELLIVTKKPVAGGGGEIIKASLGLVFGTSTISYNSNVYSKVLVNGAGGFSTNPTPVELSYVSTTDGLEIYVKTESASDMTVNFKLSYSD